MNPLSPTSEAENILRDSYTPQDTKLPELDPAEMTLEAKVKMLEEMNEELMSKLAYEIPYSRAARQIGNLLGREHNVAWNAESLFDLVKPFITGE